MATKVFAWGGWQMGCKETGSKLQKLMMEVKFINHGT